MQPGPSTPRPAPPTQLDPLVYLGDWSAAEAVERHAELGIRAVLTIHNNPGNLALPPGK